MFKSGHDRWAFSKVCGIPIFLVQSVMKVVSFTFHAV